MQYLWTQCTDSINDMHVVSTDAIYYQSKTSENCLKYSNHEKKKKYLNACLNERLHLNPFVASVNGLLGVKAEATLKHITICLIKHWKEPYSLT